MTTPTFLAPSFWYDLLVGLQHTTHFHQAKHDTLIIESLHGPNACMTRMATPTLQVLALWGALEPHTEIRVRSIRRHTPMHTSFFHHFSRHGAHGDIRVITLSDLGLCFGIDSEGDAYVANTGPTSAHTQISRAQTLAPWARGDSWPETITTPLLERAVQLGQPTSCLQRVS